MADILRIAKDRREALLAEIGTLDDFIRMAETLEQEKERSASSLIGLRVEQSLQSSGEGIDLEVGDEPCTEGSSNSDAEPGGLVVSEPPRLLLPYYPADAISHTCEKVDLRTARISSPTPKPRSHGSHGSYLELVRRGIQRHFSGATGTVAVLSAEPTLHESAYSRGASTKGRQPNRAETPIGPHLPGFIKAIRAGIKQHFTGVRDSADQDVSNSELVLVGLSSGEDALDRLQTELPDVITAAKPIRGQSSLTARPVCSARIPRKKPGSLAYVADTLKNLSEGKTPSSRSLDIYLGQKVRQRRWMMGMSRKQLGERLGVAREQIDRYESGAEEIDAKQLWKIATALKVPTASFFEGLDGQAPDTGDARAEVISDGEALLELGAFPDDTIVFSSLQSA